MSLQMGFVLIVLILMVLCLIFELARPEYIVFFALSLFILTGILTPAEALRGFSNQELMTIALLFIVAGAVQQSGILNTAVKKMIGTNRQPRINLVRMMGLVSAFSALINNTPIVVMLISELNSGVGQTGFLLRNF